MSFVISQLAEQKHQETKHSLEEWTKALESAEQSLGFLRVNMSSLSHIAKASRSPAKFTTITRLLYQYGKTHPKGEQIADSFLQAANNSSFSLNDWIEATDYFYTWLQTHKRKSDLHSMLQYMECCVASPDAKDGGQTFLALVADMLATCGYVG